MRCLWNYSPKEIFQIIIMSSIINVELIASLAYYTGNREPKFMPWKNTWCIDTISSLKISEFYAVSISPHLLWKKTYYIQHYINLFFIILVLLP